MTSDAAVDELIRLRSKHYMEEISPRTIVERSIQSWWFVILAILAGGLIGYLVHKASPPVYEAEAVFSISIDFSITGRLDLTEEDIALETAAGLIVSTPVVEQVITQAQAENLPVDSAFISTHYRFERKSEAWELAVRSTDPELAARLVNIWAPLGIQRLDEASRHALQADSIRTYLSSLETCLQRSSSSPGEANLCTLTNLASLQTELAASGSALQEEIAASAGFNPAVRYALLQTPDVPEIPIRRGANSMVLAGALAGFIIAVWAVQTNLPTWLAKKLRRA